MYRIPGREKKVLGKVYFAWKRSVKAANTQRQREREAANQERRPRPRYVGRGRHLDGPCGNIGCRRCNPSIPAQPR